MFNRQPFNRGKFNIASSGTIGNSGIGIMVMSAEPTNVYRVISANGVASMRLDEMSDATRIIFSSSSIASLVLETTGEGTKVFRIATSISNMVMTTQANQSLAGESLISLEGINLKPGDELIVNNCDMTITINGQNAMEYFNSESEFFNLLNGLNKLIYSDSNSSREISFDVIWKDRWL